MKSFNSEKFFASLWVQKLLLIVAPFVLHPDGSKAKTPVEQILSSLHLNMLAPFIGTGFMVSALFVTFRMMKKRFVDLSWLVNFESIEALTHVSLGLALLAYIASITRYLGPRILHLFIKTKEMPAFSFSFWTARYGGIMMFFGFIAWVLTFIFWIQPSLGWLIFLLVVVGSLLFLSYMEIRRQYIRIHDHYDAMMLKKINITELILFVLLSLFSGAIYFSVIKII